MQQLQLIDLGVKGDPTTGDVLYDGAEKVNNSLNSMYEKFTNTAIPLASRVIHVDGYYNIITAPLFTPVDLEIGSKYEIDTTLGIVNLTLPLATKVGESISIRNLSNSWHLYPVNVSSQTGENIISPGTETLQISNSLSEIKFVIDAVGSWKVSITDPLDVTINSSWSFENIQFEETDYPIIGLNSLYFDNITLEVTAVHDTTVNSSIINIIHNKNVSGTSVAHLEDRNQNISGTLYTYAVQLVNNNVILSITPNDHIDKIKIKVLNSTKL